MKSNKLGLLIFLAYSFNCNAEYVGSRFIGLESIHNLSHLGERHYSRSLGRFITQDGFKQYHSHYNYLNGNTLASSDPYGLTGGDKKKKIAPAEKHPGGAEGGEAAAVIEVLEDVADTLEGNINKEDVKGAIPKQPFQKSARVGKTGSSKGKAVIESSNGPKETYPLTEFLDPTKPATDASLDKGKLVIVRADELDHGQIHNERQGRGRAGSNKSGSSGRSANSRTGLLENNPISGFAITGMRDGFVFNSGATFNRIETDRLAAGNPSSGTDGYDTFNNVGIENDQYEYDDAPTNHKIRNRVLIGVGILGVAGGAIFGIVELVGNKKAPAPTPPPCVRTIDNPCT
ncbi:hypothetical protein BJAS_P3468 [Bathymodiolus japonicus methanotrophic gill symbiont]|uniref:hypothetical protein n=1 Tax=Bathymodiolus japonicus methanotrophic gill symbiont TaxID=113269 RepID=UPI001B7B1304|nr:hypothetical protein [Bathymodiolus japonicus methanotrophic gill symbiont]GFO72931.1 hypothetical protein BJAS_P3468 [Bathymodiolus japonicus methanotrophic gill symbiont]